MELRRKKYKSYSMDFKLQTLQDYYATGFSKYRISKKYGIAEALFSKWVRLFESKSLSLPPELKEMEEQVYMAEKKSRLAKSETNQSMTELERLREENLRLRKVLSYSELRNEALNEVLKIGREKYGLDLLKKAGAKQ